MKGKRVIMWGFLAIVMVIITGIFMFGRSESGPPTTKINSSHFKVKQEKIEFLKKYVTCFSEVIDTEYNIEFYNNSGGFVPGPSDWNITVALKVPLEKVNNWIKGFEEIEKKEMDLFWWDGLELDKTKWKFNTPPKFYKRNGNSTYIVTYEEEGVVLKKMLTY